MNREREILTLLLFPQLYLDVLQFFTGIDLDQFCVCYVFLCATGAMLVSERALLPINDAL